CGGQPRPYDVVQTHLGGDGIAYRRDEAVGVLDAPEDVVFDHDVLLVARQEFRRARVVDAHAPIEVERRLEGPLGVEAGAGYGAYGPAELRDEHKLGLADGEERQVNQDQCNGRNNEVSVANQHHLAPRISTPSSSRNRWRRALVESMINFFRPGSTCSMV